MTEAQKQAVLARDLNRCIGFGATSTSSPRSAPPMAKSFQQMAGSMTGMTEEEYRNMMLAGGRSPRATATGEDGDAQAHRQPQGPQGRNKDRQFDHGKITASVFASNIVRPSAGARPRQRQRALLAAAVQRLRYSKQWMKDNTPDVIFLVYNDHATAFSLEMIPTLPSAARSVSTGGRRLRCAASAGGAGHPSLRRTSRNRSSSRISISPSSTRWTSITA